MEIPFWKDENRGIVDPELFSEKAKKLAEEIFRDGGERANKPSQIRKFYDEVIRFDTMVKKEQGGFERLLPYLKMLNAKVLYAEARGHVSQAFSEFISSSIKQVRNRADLEVMKSLFEAFMGFYKYNCEVAKKESRNRRSR